MLRVGRTLGPNPAASWLLGVGGHDDTLHRLPLQETGLEVSSAPSGVCECLGLGGGEDSARGPPFCGGLSTSLGTCTRADGPPGRRLSGADLSHTVEIKPPRMPRRAGDQAPGAGLRAQLSWTLRNPHSSLGSPELRGKRRFCFQE